MYNELTTTDILSLVNTTKEDRKSFIESHVHLLKMGLKNPLEAHIHAKNMEQMLKELLDNKEYKQLVLEEAGKYGKSFERFNAKVEIRETGTRYDFSVCEDEEYNRLKAEMDILKEKMKCREKLLKTIPESGIVCPENGNMIYRASSTSTTSVVVTLK